MQQSKNGDRIHAPPDEVIRSLVSHGTILHMFSWQRRRSKSSIIGLTRLGVFPLPSFEEMDGR